VFQSSICRSSSARGAVIATQAPDPGLDRLALNHRQGKLEPVALGLLENNAVKLETRQVLRRCGRNQPAVIADRNKDAKLHGTDPSRSELIGALPQGFMTSSPQGACQR